MRTVPPTDPELSQLLDAARKHTMTPEERRAQRISWAYGNVAIENPNVTREMVEQSAEELERTERILDVVEESHLQERAECPHNLLERTPGDFTNDRRCVDCRAVFKDCRAVFDNTDYSGEYMGISRAPVHLGHHIGPVHPDIMQVTLPERSK